MADPNVDSVRPMCNLGCNADICDTADVPVYMRPYYCRYVTDEDRRIRDFVAQNDRSGVDS
jgi:hypothetical protein